MVAAPAEALDVGVLRYDSDFDQIAACHGQAMHPGGAAGMIEV